MNLLLVNSIRTLSRRVVEWWSSVSEIICILRCVILDANYCSYVGVYWTYISLVKGDYKNLCWWVDCRWFFIHCPSLLVDLDIFDCDCAQYILFIILDHSDHVVLFGLFWLSQSILLFASFVLSPINDHVIIAEPFIFEISDKNVTPR